MAGGLLLGVALVTWLFVVVASTGTSVTSDAHATSKVQCRRVWRCPKNEEFSYCPESLQRPQYCKERGHPFTPPVGKTSCNQGCVCKENYLRAENGTCIPAEQCEIKCGAHEILVQCPGGCDGSDACPTKEPSQVVEPCIAPAVCLPPICRCAFNYRRALNGTCIPTKECPPFDCSARPNEKYDPCPPICPSDDCSQASPTGVCPKRFGRIGIVLPCNPKCRCIKDFWRLNGTCVYYGQCPGVCPKNERYSGCIQAECRALNCSQKDGPISCPRVLEEYCEKGCVCNEGYLRHENGTCVPEDKCENPITCGDNEVLDTCPSSCDESDSCPTKEPDENAEPCIGPAVCLSPVCKCAFNYRRALNGTCIPTRECPPFDCSSKPNQKYDPCPPICPTDDCSQASPTGECPKGIGRIGIVLPCNPKCRCIKDFWRLNGTCVYYGQCPGVCPNHERYSGCIQGECRALDCTQKDKPIKCPRIDPKYCKKGCVCEEGYLQNKNGTCVPEDKCDVCPEHETYSTCIQGGCKARNCTQKGKPVPCVKIDPKYCIKGCVCEEGYLRNKKGKCVPEENCESSECPENETYSTCIQGGCRAQNCTQKGKPVPCVKIDPKYCKKGCVCEEGYLRNKKGKCVPEDQCESPTCGDNEVLDTCPSSCDESDSCSTEEPDENAEPCIGPAVCLPPVCKCAFNYRRALNGTCIPTRECPPFDCSSKPNQKYDPCPPICPTDDCSQASPTGECPKGIGRIGIVLPCNPKCRCIKDFWRLNGTCVYYGQCPGVCPNHERYSGCIQGECRALDCTQKDKPIKCPRIDPKYCKKGCVCEEGYLRNKNGTCVPEDKCDGPTCGDNEVLDTCPSSCDESDSCPTEEPSKDAEPCIGPAVCLSPVCKCAFNYHRSLNGTCIPTKECPPFDCSSRPNEEYDPCPPLCPTDDCSQASPTGECPSQFGRIGIVLPCNPQCRCIKDFWRLNGTCVYYGQCPGVCPNHERYSGCIQGECRALNCTQKGKSIACPRIDPKYCEKGCVCEEGYLRHENGTCVPEDKCNVCPKHERLSSCIQGECRALNCTQKGKPVPCVKIDPKYCKKGCVCNKGYLRNKKGKCVPEDKCESSECPKHERYSTCIQGECRALNCTQKDKPVPCVKIDPKYCLKGCVCEEGYLRNKKGKCVAEDKCEKPSCPANEEYVPCMQGVCRAKLCTEKYEDVPCPDIPTEKCDSGCICKENYLRAADGTCVPEDQCETCPQNEEWSTCAQATCRAQNCTEKGKPIACPMIMEGYCIKACVCKSGYLRDKYGDCIPEDQCPPEITCGDNEVLDNCPKTCTSDFCPKSADEEQVCVASDPCVPGCKCRFNYRRAENGTCIPTTSCPPFDCSHRRHEKYVACPPLCPTDECGQPRLTGRCPYKIGIVLNCNPQCQCKDGYGRVNGTCVPFSKCPDLCPANEEYSPCIQRTCRPQNCSDSDVVMKTCPKWDDKLCERGCVCKKGFYRNAIGKCVTKKQCRGPLCPYAHEVYVTDFKACPPNTCESLVSKYQCDENQVEERGCRCESGYLRPNLTAQCIPICECKQMKNTPACQ